MTLPRWMKDLTSWMSEPNHPAVRSPKHCCGDCPIVMSCGLEPRETCLPRLEAIQSGRRRKLGPQDTGNSFFLN